jgi:hypothetical protein
MHLSRARRFLSYAFTRIERAAPSTYSADADGSSSGAVYSGRRVVLSLGNGVVAARDWVMNPAAIGRSFSPAIGKTDGNRDAQPEVEGVG